MNCWCHIVILLRCHFSWLSSIVLIVFKVKYQLFIPSYVITLNHGCIWYFLMFFPEFRDSVLSFISHHPCSSSSLLFFFFPMFSSRSWFPSLPSHLPICLSAYVLSFFKIRFVVQISILTYVFQPSYPPKKKATYILSCWIFVDQKFTADTIRLSNIGNIFKICQTLAIFLRILCYFE